ncbi:reverse transcriptase domain-containing protein, partial [Tanacetum coccineum]
ETIEFFSEYHKSMETIGIPPDKHETDENEKGKPLSAGKSSEVFTELFQKAHLYVIQNTDEIVPYIERHKQVLKIENLGKRIAFLKNEHNKSFAKWLHKEVERELAIFKESVSETVRWISYGPRTTVVKYDAYNINGYTFQIIEISSDSSEDRKGATKAIAPIFYGPSTQGFLYAYGYNKIEKYLSRNYFPSTDNESTNLETTDKRNTDKDCIVDSNFAMSKACICTLHLQIAYAHCICTLHLQLAFAHCTCTLHLHAKVWILQISQENGQNRTNTDTGTDRVYKSRENAFKETFSEAWERFKELLRACPHHGFTELTQVDTFYNGLNENEQDSLNAAAGGNLLSKTTREALNIIENKSKVRYSRNRSNASRMNATSSKTDERIDKLADQLSTLVEIVSKKVVTPAPVKAVEETCVTCGGAHSWYNCPATDNNQASVCATTGTYNQVNPPNRVSNQMAPPGFAPVQNNGQNRFNQNQVQGNNFNRGNNFHGGLFQNHASTSGTLPSNTIPNPKGEMKAITTRSGVAYEGPSIPTNPSPKKVVERETKKTTDKEQSNFQGSTAQIPPPVNPIPILEPDVPKTLPKPNIPYPSRRNDQKSRDKASNQMEKIFQIIQDLRFDISFADALLLMPRFAPTIKSLLMNKEKLLELAKIPLNENCSAMLLKKLPEKLGDPGKFLIPCNFLGMDIDPDLVGPPKSYCLSKVGNFHFPTDFVVVDFEVDPRVPLILGRSFLRTILALIDVYEGELVLRDGNEQIIFHVDGTSKHPQKHVNESIKIVNDPIEGYFQSTLSAEEIVPIPRESEDTSRSDSKNILPSCDDFSSINVLRNDSVTFSNPLFDIDVNFKSSDINPLFDKVLEDIECKDSYDSNLDESTFLVTPLSDSNKDECLAPGDDIEILLHHDPSTPMKSVASILEGFIDDPPFEENDDLFDLECKTNDWKRILYDAPIDEAECFDPGGDNDEIDAFLAIEVPTYIEEGYYDSEGDVIYLESLLSDDTTHNLSPEVFFDHEPQHIKNESDHDTLITFSPKSDPLHHEFAGEVITIPPRIVREHKDYISLMSLLCGNSSSQSLENFRTIIESLPTSTTLVEDSDSNREEIDIFSGPNDSIPPGIESDFDSEEDIIDNLLNNDPIPEYKHLTFDMEPDMPVINNVDELNENECFDPGGGKINVEVDDSFTFVIQTFLPYLTYPEVSPLLSSTENEDTIFDPGIFAFHCSS